MCGRKFLCSMVLFSVASLWGAGAQLRIIPQQTLQQAATPTLCNPSAMLFDNEGVVRFGTVVEDGDRWQGEIAWRNNHSESLAIVRVQSSCSCLRAEFSPRSIEAGKSSSIGLTFDPKGRMGNVEQRLFVYTTLSDEHPTAIVRLTGRVVAGQDRSTTYPHSAGTLLLRQKNIDHTRGERQVAQIAIYNASDKPLEVKHHKGLTSKGIEAHSEPRVLPPKSSGDLVVEIEASAEEPMLLFLEGPTAPPRERQIVINVK